MKREEAEAKLAEIRDSLGKPSREEQIREALKQIEKEASGNSGENTYVMNGKLLRILNFVHDALAALPVEREEKK